MTITDVLTTRPRRRKAIVKNNGNEHMTFPQIQFASDCIRRYAINKGMRLDDALIEIQKAGGIEFIRQLYAENPTKKIGFVVRQLEQKMAVG